MEFDDEGELIKNSAQKRVVTVDEFFEEIARISAYFPEMNAFSLVMSFYQRDICPQSLVQDWCVQLMNLENAASRYHVLPLPGSYLEQPPIIIEAFEVVRNAIIEFENEVLKKATTEIKGKQ